MTLLKQSISWLLAGTLASVGAAFTAGNAIAQSSDLDPLEGLGTDDDGSNLFGDSSNPFELFHDAVLSPSMSKDEFQQRQQRAIGGEAESFRQRQQEALRQQQGLEAIEADDTTVDGDLL